MKSVLRLTARGHLDAFREVGDDELPRTAGAHGLLGIPV